jgi:hypothetical protein
MKCTAAETEVEVGAIILESLALITKQRIFLVGIYKGIFAFNP